MDAGQLKHQLVLQRKEATRDSIGGEVIAHVDFATVAGNANPVRGREFMALQQSDAEIDVVFTIYYRSDVDATCRVKWRGQAYDITSPPMDVRGEKQWLEIMGKTAQI